MEETIPKAPLLTGHKRDRKPVKLVRIATLPGLQDWLSSGGLQAWRGLARADEHASFFQDISWCVTWYQSYEHQAEPRVLAGYDGDKLVYLAALARLRSARTLTWAGHSWADYRDVIAKPAWREDAIRAILAEFKNGSYRGAFMWGFTQPESPSVATLQRLAPALGIGVLATTHPCYRTSLDGTVPAATYQKKESVRRHLSAFRRRGTVELLRITDAAGWSLHRETFFAHHSLRQLSAERATSFDDPAKQRFYDNLFSAFPEHLALHVLTVGGSPLAEHVGFIWKDILYFGAPAYDVIDQRRSPGQVLLALMLQDAEAMGVRMMDLTIGESSYKQRFGTEKVDLPNAQLYVRGARWWLAAAFRNGVKFSRSVITKRGGDSAWIRVRSLLQRKQKFGARSESTFVASVTRESQLLSGGTPPLFIHEVKHAVKAQVDDPRIVWNSLRPILAWGNDVDERGTILRLLLQHTDAGSRLLIAVQGDTVHGWALLRPATRASKGEESSPAALYGVVLDSRFDQGAAARSILAAAHIEAQNHMLVYAATAAAPMRAACTAAL